MPTDRWAATVARRLLETLQAPAPVLCLPTGATPRPAYARVISGVDEGRATLERATVFLLDEFGGLPPGDPARCDRMIRADLLDHLTVGRLHAPAVDGGDPDAACAAYEAAIAAAGGLDLAVVGLGRNGHVGLNEPGSAADSRARVVKLHPSTQLGASAYGATATPTWGVTMGIATLLEAREVWLLVTGAHKRAILRRALEGPVTDEVPASLLRAHPRLVVIADADAAGA